MKTIAITGSSGFIGTWLIKSLNKEEYKVIEFDKTNGIDLCSWSDISHFTNIDVIIHLAAKSFVPDSFINPQDFFYNNYISTLNILELAKKNNSKVIFFSSYLYGNPHYLPIDELHPISPHNPYAQSKLICENLCEGYNRDFGIPIIIFRPFNIYGPNQNYQFLIPNILNQLKKGNITLKDPRPKRDYIYISDVVNAIIKAIYFDKNSFDIYNLGTGISYSVKELADLILENIYKSHKLVFTNEFRKGDVMDTIADISKAKNTFEWYPKVSLEEGIVKIIREI